MRCHYITIEREYGSGGTKVGRRLAEELGIPCYGKEILELVSRKQNIPVEKIEQYEESATNSLMYSIYMMSQIQAGSAGVLSREGQIHLEEQEVIRNLAGKGKAVFLGHCASEALKDREGVLKVYIHAEKPEKEKRIKSEYGIAGENIDAVMKRFDKKRANYYYANTGKKWNDLWSYDVVLNSSRLGTEGCAALLRGMME